MREIAPLDPERLIRTLAAHGVRYILIGAVAARLQGFPRMTADADITPSRDPDNLRLDVAFVPSGTEGYGDLIRNALRFEVFGVTIAVASLPDIIRSKEAADRPQDRDDVAILRRMLEK